MDDVDAGGVDESGGVAGDQRDIGAALCRDPGHGVALLSRAAVPDEPHRVDGFAGAARGHQHLDSGQVVGQCIAAGQQQLGQRGDLLGFRQPAGAGVGTRQPTGRRFQDDRAAAAQRGDVVDGGRVKPHLGVHGGCEQHGTSRGQQRRGQQIVGAARHGAREQVCGGRGDHNEVGFLADSDVRHLMDVVPDAGMDRLAGKGFEGGGADKTQRGLGGDDLHGMAGLGELTDHGRRLVGGDASGDADDDPLAVRHAAARPSSPQRLIPAFATRPRCARAGPNGSREARSTVASPAGRARPAGRRTRGCRRRAGCSSR